MICMIQLMIPGGSRTFCTTYKACFPGLDLYYAGPAQAVTSAGYDLDDLDRDLSDLLHDLDRDLSDLSVRGS